MRKIAFVLFGLMLFTVSCSTPSAKKGNKSAEELQSNQILELPPLTNFTGDVFVDFNSKVADYQKLAVLPFKSPVEQAGVSVSDFFTTELLKTARYELVERSQMENVLKEQELRLSGVIEDKMAAQLGKILGVQGVIVGNVSEYGVQKSGFSTVPSIGLSIRMIDSTTGKIVWSVSHSLVGKSGTSLSQHSKDIVEQMVLALSRAWIDAGDIKAAGIPPPSGTSAAGLLRKAVLTWASHVSDSIAGYEILRKDPGSEDYSPIIRLRNTRQGKMSYEDTNLKDLSLYSYEIRTISKYGLSSTRAAKVEVITAGIPLPPVKISAESNKIRQVPLTWKASDDPAVAGYIVFRQNPDNSLATVARLKGRQTVSCIDKGDTPNPLGDNQTYTYRIKSFNEADVESEPSAPVTATTRQPPSKPSGINAVSGMPQAVAVRWTGNPENEEIAGYIVYRSDSLDGPFEEIGKSDGVKTLKYVDQKSRGYEIKNGATYYYRIAAYNTGGAIGPQSEVVNATTKPAPSKPRELTASTGRVKEVSLKWAGNPEKDVTSYVIYRSFAKNGRLNNIGKIPAGTLTFTDKGLSDSESYWYQVAAADKDGLESDPSDPAEGTTKPPPNPPTNLACTPQGSEIQLSWTGSDSPDAEKYIIYGHSFFRSWKIDESKTTSFTVKNLNPGSSYKFSVSAVDKDGLEGRRSSTVKSVLSK
ncbi:MAG: DUF799 family lipoprotein [Kiritimatiellae bacterium]|nr:DUF799 family lipoprotein [Kiritimatiellia bacterium]MDD5519412.1 DUF799 family lipoprotein [Kiritimatiellia bacterium]